MAVFGSKIFHVEFADPVDGPEGPGCHFYFGSLAAIYGVFPASLIGVSLGSIYSHHRGEASSGGTSVVYSNARVTIREGVIIRKPKKNKS